MGEYIEREAVVAHLRECEGTPPEIGYTYPIYKAIERFVESVPAANVVPVVRCKECKHSFGLTDVDGNRKLLCTEIGKRGLSEKDFCSFGEKVI